MSEGSGVMEKEFRVGQVLGPEVGSAAGTFAQVYAHAVVGKIREMEVALEPGQALMVLCEAPGGIMRVERVEFTNSSLIVVHGKDGNDNPTIHITTSFALELTCRVVSVEEGSMRESVEFEGPEIRSQRARGVGV